MSEAAFLALTGPVLWHLTPAANLAGITRHGLLRPVTLCELAEEEPTLVHLRAETVVLRLGRERARVTHQQALLAGEGRDFLDGHTLESWGAQLNRRLFFWPDGDRGPARDEDGVAVVAADTVAIAVDAARLYRAFGREIDLAPINTGAALIRPVARGDWIYVPATEAARFPEARVRRGLVKRADRVVEVSLRGDLTLPRLSLVLAAPLPRPA